MKYIQLPMRRVGDFSVTAISDGYIGASLNLLSNIDEAEACSLQRQSGLGEPGSIHVNGYLIRAPARTILIDTGMGSVGQGTGRLLANLALAGVRPAEIDTILLTHAHPDHIGGLVDVRGNPIFPNAEPVVHQGEVRFWQDDAHLSRASEQARGSFALARQVFDRYRDKMRMFTAGQVLPGISALALPGHTAGHSGYQLQSAGSGMLIWGDVVHFPAIQIARPDVSIAYDQDPVLAVCTRSRLLEMVSSERLLVAGMHMGPAGFAYVDRVGKRYTMAYAT